MKGVILAGGAGSTIYPHKQAIISLFYEKKGGEENCSSQ